MGHIIKVACVQPMPVSQSPCATRAFGYLRTHTEFASALTRERKLHSVASLLNTSCILTGPFLLLLLPTLPVGPYRLGRIDIRLED